MNAGEKNEFLLKIYLTYLRDNNPKLKTCFGPIKSVGFGEKEYKSCPKDIDFDSLENNSDNKKKVEEKIEEINKSLNIEKSSPQNKADIYINKIAYSIKYMDAGKPSIVNHTTRKGFLRIAKQLKLNIEDLDGLIKIYWDLRNGDEITEDCSNLNEKSPFKDKKEILKPYIEYYCFTGTGSKDSKHPAQKLVRFNCYSDHTSWKIIEKSKAIDEIWDGLYFCMRDIKKGGVKNYENHPDKSILKPWTRFSSGKFRGALSVRYKSSN